MGKKIVTDDGEVIDAPIPSKGVFVFKTPFNHDTDAEALRTATVTPEGEVTKTQQNLADEQEMKTILSRYFQTGQLEQTSRPMTYGDVGEPKDLLDTIVTTAEIMDAWNALPVKARAILRDPKTFVEYMEQIDEESGDDLVHMGLATRKEPPPATPVSPTPAVGTPATAPATAAPGAANVTAS